MCVMGTPWCPSAGQKTRETKESCTVAKDSSWTPAQQQRYSSHTRQVLHEIVTYYYEIPSSPEN